MQRFTIQDIESMANDELTEITYFIRNFQYELILSNLKQLLQANESYFQKIDIELVCDVVRNRSTYNNLLNQCKTDVMKVLSQLLTVSHDGQSHHEEPITNDSVFHYGTVNKTLFMKQRLQLVDALYLLDFSNVEVQVIRKNGSYVSAVESCRIDYTIESVDYFQPEIYFFIEVDFDFNADEINLEDLYISFDLDYKFIPRGTSLPVWLENILISSLYQKRNNYRLSLFYAYVAFDSFIQSIYYHIGDYIETISSVDFYKSRVTEYSEHGHVDLDYMIGLISDRRLERTIQRVERHLIESLDDYAGLVKCECNQIWEPWHNQRRKLIEEKLKSIRKLLDIDYQTDFSGLNSLEQDIKEIRTIRDTIAHGIDRDGEIDTAATFKVLTYILSIILDEDLKKENWQKLMFSEF